MLSEATDDEDFSVKEQEIEKALYDFLKWFETVPVEITASAQNNDDTLKRECPNRQPVSHIMRPSRLDFDNEDNRN